MTTHKILIEECCVCGGASDVRGEAGEPLCAPCWDDVQDAREFYAAKDIGYQNRASAASDMEAMYPVLCGWCSSHVNWSPVSNSTGMCRACYDRLYPGDEK